jgi:4-methylaminobutanoate oxidase (formaldehyde-forming)
VCIVLEDPRAVALGSEPVRIDGQIVGRVTSGGYGYTVERSIAYAYVPADDAETGTPVEIEIFGDWIAGEVARSRSTTLKARRFALRAQNVSDTGPKRWVD